MTKRLKVLLTIFVVLVLVFAVGLVYFQKKLKSSADAFPSSSLASLTHHVESPATPVSPFKPLAHHHEITVTVNPANVTLEVGKTQQFTAIVNGTTNKAVTWKVVFMGPGAHGTVDAKTGLYTATSATGSGTEAVFATSMADPNSTGLARIINVAPNYVITSSVGAGGIMTPSGMTSVKKNNTQIYSIKPNAGYAVSDVNVDGKSVGKVSSYTFPNVTADHKINATFAPIPLTGNIRGQVNYGGKPAIGAIVTAKNLTTNVSKVFTTSATGGYNFNQLPVGNYGITANLKVCKKILFWSNCSTKTGSAKATVSPNKTAVISTINL